MLGQLGRPLFAWSGGNAGVVRRRARQLAASTSGFDAVPPAYARDRQPAGAAQPLRQDVDALYTGRAARREAAAPHRSPTATRREAAADSPARSRGVRLELRRRRLACTVTYEYDPANDGWRRSQNGTHPHGRGRSR